MVVYNLRVCFSSLWQPLSLITLHVAILGVLFSLRTFFICVYPLRLLGICLAEANQALYDDDSFTNGEHPSWFINHLPLYACYMIDSHPAALFWPAHKLSPMAQPKDFAHHQMSHSLAALPVCILTPASFCPSVMYEWAWGVLLLLANESPLSSAMADSSESTQLFLLIPSLLMMFACANRRRCVPPVCNIWISCCKFQRHRISMAAESQSQPMS